MKDGTPYYDLYVGSSNLTGAALTTQREWNLKVSSLADGELVGQFQDEIDSQVADSVPLTEEWIKQYEEDFKKYAPPRHEILQSFEGHDIQPTPCNRRRWRISRNFVNKASTAQLSCRPPAPERRTFPHSTYANASRSACCTSPNSR